MCRLYGFRANEPTKVECTLVRAQNALLIQSQRDLRGYSHPDGWGIAVYEEGAPQVERHYHSASEDPHFSVTAERIFGRTVVAHVRQATIGETSALNSHPFTFGDWVFAHNGTVRGFDTLGPILEKETGQELLKHRHGSTDSELSFLWLLSRVAAAGVDLSGPAADPAKLAAILSDSITVLARRCSEAAPDQEERLNLLLTDGRSMIISRWKNGLWFVERSGVHDCEICGVPHVQHQSSVAYRAIVAASEPISHEDWQEVPDAHVLVVTPSVSSYLLAI